MHRFAPNSHFKLPPFIHSPGIARGFLFWDNESRNNFAVRGWYGQMRATLTLAIFWQVELVKALTARICAHH